MFLSPRLRLVAAAAIILLLTAYPVFTCFNSPDRIARRHMARGEYAQAAAVLKEALEYVPDDDQLGLLYASVLARQRSWRSLNTFLQTKHDQGKLELYAPAIREMLAWLCNEPHLSFTSLSHPLLNARWHRVLAEENLLADCDVYLETVWLLASVNPNHNEIDLALELYPHHPVSQLLQLRKRSVSISRSYLDDLELLIQLDVGDYSPAIQSIHASAVRELSHSVAMLPWSLSAAGEIDVPPLVARCVLENNWTDPDLHQKLAASYSDPQLENAARALAAWQQGDTDAALAMLADDASGLARAIEGKGWQLQPVAEIDGDAVTWSPDGDKLVAAGYPHLLIDLASGWRKQFHSNTDGFMWNPTGTILAVQRGSLYFPGQNQPLYVGGHILGWLSDTQVAVSLRNNPDSQPAVFDIETGETQPWPQDKHWSGIYPNVVYSGPGGWRGGYTHKEHFFVADFSSPPWFSPGPTVIRAYWSPDGKYLAAVGHNRSCWLLHIDQRRWQQLIMPGDWLLGWWDGNLLFRTGVGRHYLYYTVDIANTSRNYLYLGPEKLTSPSPNSQYVVGQGKVYSTGQ